MSTIEEILPKLCPYLQKESQELSEGERNTLLGLLSKTVIFINKANIIPRPDVFYRWFLVHCYLLRKGIKNPTYDTLFKTYDYIDELLEKVELSSSPEVKQEREIHLLTMIVKDLKELLSSVSELIRSAKRELLEKMSQLLSKEQLTAEEIASFMETLSDVEINLKTEINGILAKIKGLENRVEELSEKISLEVTECMKPSVFKAIVRKLVDRCANTGNYFTLVLIRINQWDTMKEALSEEARVKYLNDLCRAIKSELRSYDYVTCFKDKGLLAVAIRNVGIKIAHRVIQRIEPVISNIEARYLGKSYSSTFGFALVEGRGILPYGKLMEKAHRVLELCSPNENSIRSEVDLVGKATG